LQTALDEKYRCLECSLVFDATEAVLEEKQKLYGDEIKELLEIICPNCGSHNIRPAARHHSMPSGAMVTCT
jgi:DNA-directed RNA polymerase subunit RPC12/RpoP